MIHRRRTATIALALALALTGCTRDDDDAQTGADTDTADAAETREAETDTAEQPSTTPPSDERSEESQSTDALDDCLARPAANTAGRDGAGKVEAQENDRVEVDCVEVFGGEPLLEQAVIASDGSGAARFEIDIGADCTLRSDTTVEVVPEPDVLLAVRRGEILCDVFGDGLERSLRAGDDLTIMTTSARVLITVAPDVPPSVTVFDGYVLFDPPTFGCRSVVGPRQQIELAATPMPAIVAFDPRNLSDALRGDLLQLGGRVEPPEIPEALLPGLASLLDDGDVTLAVDGELVGSSTADEASDVLVVEHIVGREVLFDESVVGQVEILGDVPVLEPVAPAQIPDFGLVDVGALVAEAVEEDAVEEALEENIRDVAELPILTDPDGGTWTVVFDGADIGLAATLDDQLRSALDSGAYAVYHEAAFEATPDYGLLRPDLLRGVDRCS